MKAGDCRVEGCLRRVHARGYCGTHYQQYLRTGQHPGWSSKPDDDEPALLRHLVTSMLRILGHDQGNVASVTLTPDGKALVVRFDGITHLHRWDAP